MNVIALDPVLDQITVPLLPRLEIVALQTIRRNCYTEVLYRVRSLVRLTESDFDYLKALGFFMHGQGFTLRSPHNGTEKLSGRWTVDGSCWVSFYEYEVHCVCDSGD
jgi:hypothetical protein